MSENIFSNLYNRVLNFFQKDRLQDAESSKDTATNRLKLVLMQDRSNLDGATMQKMREQLITVISKYVEIDQEALDLNLEADGDEIALMLNIPVIRARTREEIEEIEAQEQAAINVLKNDSEDDTDADSDEGSDSSDSSTEEELTEEKSSDDLEEHLETDDNTDSKQEIVENQENCDSDTDSQENDSSAAGEKEENSESDAESSEYNMEEHKKSKKNKNN